MLSTTPILSILFLLELSNSEILDISLLLYNLLLSFILKVDIIEAIVQETPVSV